MIPYGKHNINDKDISAVVDVLKSDWLTTGPCVPVFEDRISNYCSSKFAVAVNSATSALHVACLSLGLNRDDTVWTSPITFVASSNCALYCGAKVDFVDINPLTFNMDSDALEQKLITAKRNGNLPKIVIPVHLTGQSCEMDKIHKLSRLYKFKIIEDASHAIGASYKDEPVGNCKYSDITVFSFHPVKIITTGEGGVATTNNPKLAEKMGLYRSHGISRDQESMKSWSHGSKDYEQVYLGFNYRMTDIHAALGISQMDRLDEFVSKRHEIAEYYNSHLKNLPYSLPWQHPDTYSSFHLYVLRLSADNIKAGVDLFKELRSNGVYVTQHYAPVHIQPYYKKLGFSNGLFPHSESYHEDAFSIPMHQDLTKIQLKKIVSSLKKILA